VFWFVSIVEKATRDDLPAAKDVRRLVREGAQPSEADLGEIRAEQSYSARAKTGKTLREALSKRQLFSPEAERGQGREYERVGRTSATS